MGLGGWSAVDGRLCVVSRQLVKVETVGPKQGEAERELGSRKASVTSGNSSGMGCHMAGCGKWIIDLRGHCVQAHIPEVFRQADVVHFVSRRTPSAVRNRSVTVVQQQHQHFFLRHLKKSNNPPDTGGPTVQPPLARQVRALCPMGLCDLPISSQHCPDY
jgi:hypothetical protein